MSFWSDISRFAGNLTGGFIGESDEERKKKEERQRQEQQQRQAQAVTSSQTNPQNQNGANTINNGTQQGRPTYALNNTAQRQQQQADAQQKDDQQQGFTNKASRANNFIYRQRADKGFDFYNGDRKITKEEYLSNTGVDGNALTQKMAKLGDRTSAQYILDNTKGGLFKRDENEQRAMAQKVIDDAKRAEEQKEKEIVNTAFNNNYRLQNKRIGVKEAVEHYNTLNAWDQQRFRDELTNEAAIGDSPSELQAQKAQEALLLMAALEQNGSAKFDAAQKMAKLGVDLISGIQRGTATVADTAIMGGASLGSIGKSDEEVRQLYERTEELRNKLKEAKAVDGFALNNKEDFQFTGNAVQDIANLAGRGLDVGLSATMFANPVTSARSAAAGGVKQAVGTVLRDAATFGGADALQGGLSTYGETGDIEQALDSAVKTGAMSAVTQGALGGSAILGGVGYNRLRTKLLNDSKAAAEAGLGRELNAAEVAELNSVITSELDSRVKSGQVAAEQTTPRQEAPVQDTSSSVEMQAGSQAESETPARGFNNLGLDAQSVRERFGNGVDLGPTSQESIRALADQEINARVAQLPDENYIQQMSERFGISDNTLRRLMQKTTKSDLFRKLNDASDFVRNADVPDAAATSIINNATEAGAAAAARAGVTVPELQRAPDAPEAQGQGPFAAPETRERPLAYDSENRVVDTETGEILSEPGADIAAVRDAESAQGADLQEIPRESSLSDEFMTIPADTRESLAMAGINENNYQAFRNEGYTYDQIKTFGEQLYAPHRIVNLEGLMYNLVGKPKGASNRAVVTNGDAGLTSRSGSGNFNYNQDYADYLKSNMDRVNDGEIAASDILSQEEFENGGRTNTEPVSAQTIAQSTSALPESSKATVADINSIRNTQNATFEYLDNVEATTTPEQRAKMMQEVAQYERTGAEISPESKALYDELIAPVVDALYWKSRRAGDMGRRTYYLPEELAGTEAPQVKKFGNTWADEANMEFGHSLAREGKIDTVDLNDPVSSLKNYVQQFYQDNYGYLSPENIAEAEGRGAINGADYLNGRRNVAEKLDKSMVRSLTDKKAGAASRERVKETLGIAKDIRANADATLDPESITRFQGGVSKSRAARTNRKVAQRIEAGNGQSAYERFGMKQFENAEAFGGDAFEQNFRPGISRDEYAMNVRGYYESLYERDFADVMSPERFDEILETGIDRSYRRETTGPLAKVEQELAMEKAIYGAEHIRYNDKATQGYIDYEVGHILRRGKMPSTLARTVANNITRTFYSGALGLNPLSAIQSLTELSRVAGLTATKDTIKTLEAQVKGATPKQIKETFKSYGIDSNRIRQEMGDAIPTSKKAIKLAGKVRDKVEDTVMAGFNLTEATKNYAMLKALEIKHADIADPRLRREAIMDDFNANSLIGGHYGNLVGVDRSNAARVAMQFGTYTLRDWGQLADQVKAGNYGYVARTLGVKAALALPMYSLFGTTLAYTLGINEFKGGPAFSLTTSLIDSIIEENNRVESELEDGKKSEFDFNNVASNFSKKATPLVIPGGNYMFNKLGVQDALGIDKENKIFREDTYLGDLQKGYNANADGTPRFAAPGSTMSNIRGVLGGTYNTDEARDYFGKGFLNKPKLFGIFDTETRRHSPAYGRYQDRIEGQSKILTDPNSTDEQKALAKATIRDTFDKAYTAQDLKKEFFDSNPEAASFYKELSKTTYNKETGKRESDVITPEKWKYIEAEKSGQLFEFLRERAIQNNDTFGDPIDPIYTAELTEAQRREILNLRSSYTGDDKERKSMLYEQQWYNDFQGKMNDYYKQMNDQSYDESSDYGNTKRKAEYIQLSMNSPQRDDLYKQYLALRYGDSATGKVGNENAGKAFYKANADALTAANDKYQKAKFDWTNKMRVLEGTTPLTWDEFSNDSYGYKSDDSSSKYGSGRRSYGSSPSSSSGSSSSSSEGKKTFVADSITNFASKNTGPKKLKMATPELIDVTKVVKQPKRATKKSNIRITI